MLKSVYSIRGNIRFIKIVMSSAEIVLFWFLFIIVIISLLIFLIASFRATARNDLPKTTEDININTLRTGDVLGVGYTHPFGWFVKAWSGSMWSHTGIVWKDPQDNQIYVLEAAMYHDPYKGVFRIPILDWLRINRKSYIGLARLKGKSLDPVALIQAFEERKKHVELEGYNWRWYRLLFRTPYHEETRKRYTCYEIVVIILQDVGVVRKLYTCSSYWPYHVMKGQIHTTKGYSYDDAVLLNVENVMDLRRAEEKMRSSKGRCSRMFGSWSYD